MPTSYPQESRDDVIQVAREREPGVILAQVAKDFGTHEVTLTKWLRRADIGNGNKPGMTSGQSAQLREANKRIRLLAAHLSQANPPGKGSTRS